MNRPDRAKPAQRPRGPTQGGEEEEELGAGTEVRRSDPAAAPAGRRNGGTERPLTIQQSITGRARGSQLLLIGMNHGQSPCAEVVKISIVDQDSCVRRRGKEQRSSLSHDNRASDSGPIRFCGLREKKASQRRGEGRGDDLDAVAHQTVI